MNGIDAGNGATVARCKAYDNGDKVQEIGSGIVTGLHSAITNCTAGNNGYYGIHAGDYGSTVSSCTVRYNGYDGINGVCSNITGFMGTPSSRCVAIASFVFALGLVRRAACPRQSAG